MHRNGQRPLEKNAMQSELPPIPRPNKRIGAEGKKPRMLFPRSLVDIVGESDANRVVLADPAYRGGAVIDPITSAGRRCATRNCSRYHSITSPSYAPFATASVRLSASSLASIAAT